MPRPLPVAKAGALEIALLPAFGALPALPQPAAWRDGILDGRRR